MKTLAKVLKERFPWLGTTDDDDIPYPGGADAIQDLEEFYELLTEEPAADPFLSLRNAAEAVLHELTVGEASEGDLREIKTCARLLSDAGVKKGRARAEGARKRGLKGR